MFQWFHSNNQFLWKETHDGFCLCFRLCLWAFTSLLHFLSDRPFTSSRQCSLGDGRRGLRLRSLRFLLFYLPFFITRFSRFFRFSMISRFSRLHLLVHFLEPYKTNFVQAKRVKPSSSVTSITLFTWPFPDFPDWPAFSEREISFDASLDETSWRFAKISLNRRCGLSLHGAKNGFLLSLCDFGGILSLRFWFKFHGIRFFLARFINRRVQLLVFNFHFLFIRIQATISNSVSSLQVSVGIG